MIKYVFLLILSLVAMTTSQCNNFTLSDATDALNDILPLGDGNQNNVNILNWHVDCLATSSTQNRYKWVTFTAQFTNKGATQRGQTVVPCSSGVWNVNSNFGNYDSVSVTKYNQLFSNPTRTDCYRCSKFQPTDSLTLCAECHSSCNQGAMQCTSEHAAGCCNYYDNNNCVVQCGSNKHPDDNFNCVCDMFYNGSQCDSCNIQSTDCKNGGIANSTSCSCQCNSTGYMGPTCIEDIDECNLTNPCQHGGSCYNTNGSYVCDCATGYTGNDCQTDIDDCQMSSCLHNATCIDGVANYTCDCLPGYTGRNCERGINECESNPCQNGGTCIDEVNKYTCNCTGGFNGTDCELDIDECSTGSNPCSNGGTCRNNPGGFNCSCQGSWKGDTCETCVMSDCSQPMCNGPSANCLQCNADFSLVNGQCVSCNIKDCILCITKDVCRTCNNSYDLNDSGTLCTPPILTLPPPPEPTRDNRSSSINTGAIIGIVIAFIVLLVIIAIIIVIIIVVLGKINSEKPPTYNVKTPKPEDKDIILTKISNI